MPTGVDISATQHISVLNITVTLLFIHSQLMILFILEIFPATEALVSISMGFSPCISIKGLCLNSHKSPATVWVLWRVVTCGPQLGYQVSRGEWRGPLLCKDAQTHQLLDRVGYRVGKFIQSIQASVCVCIPRHRWEFSSSERVDLPDRTPL